MTDEREPIDPFKLAQALRAKIKARSGVVVSRKGRFYPGAGPRTRGAGTKAHPLSVEIDRVESALLQYADSSVEGDLNFIRDMLELESGRVREEQAAKRRARVSKLGGLESGRARRDRAAPRRARVIELWHELELPERNRAREIVRRINREPGGGLSRTQVDRILVEAGLRKAR